MFQGTENPYVILRHGTVPRYKTNFRLPKRIRKLKEQIIIENITRAIEDIKGRDISVIDVRNSSDVADYYMICTGTSTRHTTAIAEKVSESLHRNGIRTYGIEGEQSGDWVLLDAGSVILHVMIPQARDAYQLEKLYTA